jgi:HSP20 family molecular chaperone IbpA
MVAPLVDIYENADEILLVADVPGAAKDTISIDLHKGMLELTARRADHAADSHATEFTSYDYYRSFAVSPGIDAERIGAELINGVLRVQLPKSAALKSRRIEVKTG